jgi:hypothetical protein
MRGLAGLFPTQSRRKRPRCVGREWLAADLAELDRYVAGKLRAAGIDPLLLVVIAIVRAEQRRGDV